MKRFLLRAIGLMAVCTQLAWFAGPGYAAENAPPENTENISTTAMTSGSAGSTSPSGTSVSQVADPADGTAAQPPLSKEDADQARAAPNPLGVHAFRQTVSAVVNGATGTLVPAQSFGAVSANKVAGFAASYQVCFNAVITNGTYVATIGIPGNVGISPPGEITVVGRVGTNNCLYIKTYNSAGVSSERSFHVVVVY